MALKRRFGKPQTFERRFKRRSRLNANGVWKTRTPFAFKRLGETARVQTEEPLFCGAHDECVLLVGPLSVLASNVLCGTSILCGI